MTRRDLIKRIHVLKGELSLDDDSYRSVLESVSGHRTCLEMNDRELELALAALEKFRDTSSVRAGRLTTNGPQQRQIARLMDTLGWTWDDTAAYASRIAGKNNTRKCNASELSKIIRGMIATIDHHLRTGKIRMNHTERFEYERHVRPVREMGEATAEAASEKGDS